jgi:hypothetical protein
MAVHAGQQIQHLQQRIKELEAERDSMKMDVRQEVDDWELVRTYAANNDFDINEKQRRYEKRNSIQL